MTTGFIKCSDRDAWLEARRQGIGASDAAAILGEDPNKSAFLVWAEKTGNVGPESEMSEAAEFGLLLELPIAKAFAARTGRQVTMWENFKIVRDAEHYWLACTPDAEQFDGEKGLGLLQIKTTSEYKKEDWADGPPIKFQIQLQHELRVTGHQWGTLVVLIGGQKLRYYDCDRNDRFINAMIPKLKEFWDLVQSNTPPSVDGSLATANVLARLHPDDNGLTCMLPTEAVEWCATITDCRKQINELKALSQEAENKLVAAIGDNTFGVLSDGSKWSNKKQDRRGYYVNPTSYRVLRSVK